MTKSVSYALWVQVLIAVACAHPPVTSTTPLPVPPVSATDHSQMVFYVANAQTIQMLAGVRVTLIGRDGTEVELGKTGLLGNLTVAKALLREHHARLVLFSDTWFFTVALRVDDPELDFYSFDERFIHLAPLALR